jgi:hypothetical protein
MKQLAQGNPVEDHVVFARAARFKRRMANTQKTRRPGIGPAHFPHLGRQANKWRHRTVQRPFEVRNSGSK